MENNGARGAEDLLGDRTFDIVMGGWFGAMWIVQAFPLEIDLFRRTCIIPGPNGPEDPVGVLILQVRFRPEDPDSSELRGWVFYLRSFVRLRLIWSDVSKSHLCDS